MTPKAWERTDALEARRGRKRGSERGKDVFFLQGGFQKSFGQMSISHCSAHWFVHDTSHSLTACQISTNLRLCERWSVDVNRLQHLKPVGFCLNRRIPGQKSCLSPQICFQTLCTFGFSSVTQWAWEQSRAFWKIGGHLDDWNTHTFVSSL